MPAIVELVCEVCHKPHTFYLPGVAPASGKPQEFVCSAEGITARLVAAVADWRLVENAPKGAVKVWEVDQGFTSGRAEPPAGRTDSPTELSVRPGMPDTKSRRAANPWPTLLIVIGALIVVGVAMAAIRQLLLWLTE